MKAHPLLDAASAQAFGFDWLVAALAPASAYGERVFAELRPFAAGEEAAAQARAARIAGVASSLDDADLEAAFAALRGMPDAAGAVARASMDGVLADENLLELLRFCDAIEAIDARCAGRGGVEPVANDGVRAVAAALAIGRSGRLGFYLADAFDAGLAMERARLAHVQAELDASRGRTVERIARELGRDDLAGGEFIVMRSDLHGALPAGVRVVREAPTYLLCALQYDDAALAALERRDRAADAVAQAEEAVRARLSSVVRSHALQLDAAARSLGELDVLIAAARFTRRYRGRVAEVVAQASLAFSGGRWLPLEEALESQGRAFAPIDIALHDVAVLTGPNMGGKSVCLRTCAFVAICAAFGIPAPAERAHTGLFDEIAWLGIGGDAERGGLLSSFANEVLRLREILERGAPRLLVLVDEFARTTTPREGKALLVALLERLRASGACGLAATHLGGVAKAAALRHFAVRGLRGIPRSAPAGDLREALAVLAASMDYTVAEVTGEGTGGGDAIALAELLGLDARLIEAAHRSLK